MDITDLVRRWASGEQPNHGILISAAGPVRAFLDSKETISGFPPKIRVQLDGPRIDQGLARVLDFSQPDSCVIDQPGLYVLDRSWQTFDGGFSRIGAGLASMAGSVSRATT